MLPAVAAAVPRSPPKLAASDFSTGDGSDPVSCLCLFRNLVNPVKHVFHATTDEDIEAARALFNEYAAGLGISLCFQNFDHELSTLPGDYAPPDGRLLLAKIDDQIAGCIALRKLAPGICEMKRLFVRPRYRSTGLGRDLVNTILDEARKLGYTHMRLDPLPGRMDKAIALYRSIGFVDIEPYYRSVEGAKFMELDLATNQE